MEKRLAFEKHLLPIDVDGLLYNQRAELSVKPVLKVEFFVCCLILLLDAFLYNPYPKTTNHKYLLKNNIPAKTYRNIIALEKK